MRFWEENEDKGFGKDLQNLIQGLTHDKHLRIIYDPEKVKTKQDSLRLYKQDFEERKLINFGLSEAKILEHNIGYLKTTRCTSTPNGRSKIMASSIFLKNIDGLILDLTSSGGSIHR
jgi:hypothetical protein